MTRSQNFEIEAASGRSRSAHALAVLSRVLAATLGGYALASATAIFLAGLLPTGRAEAVLAGMQLSFIVFTGAAIWAFSPVALARVWKGLLLPAVLLAFLGWLLPRLGA
jgi:hypothetical protein